MGGFKFTVETRGFRETIKRLNPPEDLYAEPWRHAVEEMTDVGYQSSLSAAPIGLSSQTNLRMAKKVQKIKVPRWGVVKTTATRGGFAYPRITNFSPYAQSRYHTGVNPHRYWFTNALKRVDQAMSGILDKAGSAIEALWTK